MSYNDYYADQKIDIKNISAMIVDPKLKERYGTSIDNFMGKDYNKKLEQKVRDLEEEFRQIDYDQNSYLSVEEVTRFFKQQHPEVRLSY